MFFSRTIKIIIVLTLVLFLFGQLGWLNPMLNFFTWASSPVFRGARSVSLGLSDAASSLFTIRDLQKDNSELTQRVAMLQSENTRLETAIKEYDQLGQALNLKERTGFDLTAARIVS